MSQPGPELPPFSLQAAGHGRTVDNAALRGRIAVLAVHGAKTTELAKEVAKVVRTREMDAAKVALVSVVDLHSFAGLWRKIAEAQLRQTYAKLAEKATAAGLDPNEHVLVCPDWDGSVCAALGFASPDTKPGIVVADASGRIVAWDDSPQAPAAAVAAL